MSEEIKECCICSLEYIGYGNNAAPVKEGKCCDECNATNVIPSRINNVIKIYQQADKDGK
jgi:hypothetical protein